VTQSPVSSEIDRFDSSLSLEAARTPPASWYVDPRFLELEREALFRRTWQAVGRLDQVARPGDYFTGELLGDPFVVVRTKENRLAAFLNVCRHHAATVCTGAGNLDEMTCPYHGWTYALDGRLLRTPKMGRSDLLDPGEFGLRPAAAEAWGPFVFIHLGTSPSPLRESLAELEPRLGAMGSWKLHHAQSRVYDMRCNWKVYVDNYLDGGYHVAHLHRGLAGQLDLKSYRTELYRRLSIQSCASSSAVSGHSNPEADPRGDFPERMGSGAIYAWIYPNFMINRYGPVMDTNYVLPLSQDRTRVIFDYYFESIQGKDAREFIRRSVAASHTVQEEDVAISESVQRGLSSGAFDQGIYAPAFEAPMRHFHRTLSEDLRRVERRG
jgi:phenylpropionate dioxygenase-like ring-hydroxylating dioxygenase large terminal subunit